MGLNVKKRHAVESAREAAQTARDTKTEAIRRAPLGPPRKRLVDWLESEVWPAIPETTLGKWVTKRKREKILGYGKAGV